jgi:serine/threonine-protein kinase HipA
MQLAQKVGIDVPQTKILSIGELQVYQITRYDRRTENGITQRIHQEDFCQALGIVPENKYEFEGGPNMQRCDELLLGASSRPALDRQQMLQRVVFNYLIGNNDAHAKNFSLLYSYGECRLAPAYDLVSTAAYPELNQNFAMKIGGRKNAEYLQLRHWMRLVPDAQASRSSFKTMTLDLCGQIEKNIDDCTQELSLNQSSDKQIIQSIVDLVISRLNRLQNLFGE